MSIPIENVYYLLLYAWRHVQHQEQVDIGKTGKTDLLNLIAHLFTLETKRLLARGLAREYREVEEEIAGVRGRLDIGVTVKRDLLRHGKTWCRRDELEYDIQRNRILKATLRHLLRVPELDAENRDAARRLHAKMDVVRDVPLHRSLFRRVQSNRLMRDYDFALRLAELVCDTVVPDKGGMGARFTDFREDEATMHKLFEDFVFNFYALEKPAWNASRRTIRWFDAQGTDEALQHLPSMHTDVSLSLPERHVIIDAKFYQNPLSGRYGERVHSDNLYQLYSYVGNARAGAMNAPHEGILLYAAAGRPFAFKYRLNDLPIAVVAIDLGQDWKLIHRDLVGLVTDGPTLAE